MKFRRVLPDTLVGRTVFVLIAGLVLSQLAGVVLFSLNRLELASALGRRQIVEHIVGQVRLLDATPATDRFSVLRAERFEDLRVFLGPFSAVPEDDPGGEAAWIRTVLQERLPKHEFHVSLREPRPPGLPEFDGSRPPPDDRRAFEHPPGPPPNGFNPSFEFGPHRPRGPIVRVSVRLEDGAWANFAALQHPGEPLWRLSFFAPLVLGFLVVMTFSVLAVRRAAKPLAVLAAAAKRLGRDVAAPPIPIEGPAEVRAAASAFNEMQTRLRRYVDGRTQMIAAISHDLRTPITRLKLRAEFVDDDEQRVKMLADLDEMEAMISQTLAFARDETAREPRQEIDLAAIVAELCAQFGATYVGPDSLIMTAATTPLKRAFANLLENANKYGGSATVTLFEEETSVVAFVDDHGSGIPSSDLERVFQPFVRLENSRNRDTGGTGLGLAGARTAIRSHGGDITLLNRPEGGLRAVVTLPR